jgi:hypothetical protein
MTDLDRVGFGMDEYDDEALYQKRLVAKKAKLQDSLNKLAQHPQTAAFARIALNMDDDMHQDEFEWLQEGPPQPIQTRQRTNDVPQVISTNGTIPIHQELYKKKKQRS